MGSLGCVGGGVVQADNPVQTVPASSKLGGSSRAGPARQVVSVAPGPARTSLQKQLVKGRPVRPGVDL